MPILHAIVLGIVQGLSEFLPISSSGHLLVVPWLFGWDDFAGSVSLEKTFDVALHIGTLVGAVAYFRKDLVTLVRAALTPKAKVPVATVPTEGTLASDHPNVEQDRRLAWLLVVASIPAAIVGGLFDSAIEDHLGQFWLIGAMLVVFGLVLLYADRLSGHRHITEFSTADALKMGVGQALALQPGVSRSGVTITVGRAVGFDRDSAARLSFLMSLPIIAGAVLYKGAKLAHDGFPSGFAAPFLWGIVASAVTGYAAVWATLRLVRTHSFTPFVIYRVAAGALIFLVAVTGIR